jgi:hypothetical protein
MRFPDTTAGRLRWAIVVLAACAGALALHTLAQHMLRAYLRETAASTLVRLARDDTPYSWSFRRSETLIARRVFGVENFEVGDKGLQFTAQETVYEVGLSLRGALDLQRFSQLEITARAERPLLLSALVVRERLDEPERVAALPFKANGKDERIELNTLSWTDAAGTSVAAPTRAAMLRLRAQQRAGAKFSLVSMRLLPRKDLHAVDVEQPLSLHDIDDGSDLADTQSAWRLSAGSDANLDTLLSHYAATAPHDRLPLIALASSRRVEPILALRDHVLAALPSALVLPADSLSELRDAVHDAAASPSLAVEQQLAWRWGSLAAFILALLILRRWPPANLHWRAALEAVGTLAGPLWVVVGLRFGDNPDALTWSVIVASIVFALSLRTPPETPHWRWFGSWSAWRWPFLPLGIALLLALLLHPATQAWTPPTPAVAARYLGWALLQQYLICAVMSDRLRQLGATVPWTVLCAAFLFALLHTPNAALMQATFVGGLIWATCWQFDRVLLPIALSHAASALLLTALLPPTFLRSAEVSARYFL